MGKRGIAVGIALACLATLGLGTQAQAGIKIRQKVFQSPDNVQAGAQAKCKRGSDVPVSGGFLGGGLNTDHVWMSTLVISGDPTRGFTAVADNYAGGEASVTSIASVVCDTDAKHSDYPRRIKQRRVPDATVKGATAQCPAGTSVVGGSGFNPVSAFDHQTWFQAFGPVDGKDAGNEPDDAWRAELNNDEGVPGGGDRLNVFAICDDTHPAAKIHYRQKSQTIADGEFGGETSNCRPSERILGAGISSNSTYDTEVYVNGVAPFFDDPADYAAGIVENYTTPDGMSRKIEVTAICLG